MLQSAKADKWFFFQLCQHHSLNEHPTIYIHCKEKKNHSRARLTFLNPNEKIASISSISFYVLILNLAYIFIYFLKISYLYNVSWFSLYLTLMPFRAHLKYIYIYTHTLHCSSSIPTKSWAIFAAAVFSLLKQHVNI